MERGVSLVPLAVTGLSTGLYGRACVSVGDPKGRPLPAHRLGAGDQVRLYSSKGGKGDVEGGISEISGEQTAIRPACCRSRLVVARTIPYCLFMFMLAYSC